MMLSCTRWVFDCGRWRPTLRQLIQAISIIQPEERSRLMRFHFIEDFLLSMIGRLLMRKYVASITGLSYQEIEFSRDEHGKPFCLNRTADAINSNYNQWNSPPYLSFNVSHHGDYVVLAGICREDSSAQLTEKPQHNLKDSDSLDNCKFGVGIDIMNLEMYDGTTTKGQRSLQEFFRIMERKFSDNEWSYIRQFPDDDKQFKAFIRHWCLKEAYVKEIGVGITVDLREICFQINDDCWNFIDDADRHDEDLKEPFSPITATKLFQTKHKQELNLGAKVEKQNVQQCFWHFEEHFLYPDYWIAIAFRNCRPQPAKFTFLEIEDILNASNSNADTLQDTLHLENTESSSHKDDFDIHEYCEKVLRKQRKS